MWSIIGLVLDAVGAISLTFGLFRAAPIGLWGGDADPSGVEVAADDRAYGLVGGLCLFAGFAMQGVGNIANSSASVESKLIAAGVTALAGGSRRADLPIRKALLPQARRQGARQAGGGTQAEEWRRQEELSQREAQRE